jgi:hypothetical protein
MFSDLVTLTNLKAIIREIIISAAGPALYQLQLVRLG